MQANAVVAYKAFVAMDIERQKAILEVPTQLFGIWCKNMKHGQSNYLPEYITFIYGN